MRLLSPIPKVSALFFFWAFSFANLSGQGWFKAYPELYPSSDITENLSYSVRMFEGGIETPDLGFLTWGAYNYYHLFPVTTELDYEPIDIRLTKTDIAGNIQWTQLYEQGSSPAFDNLLSFTLAASPDGNGYLGFGKTTNFPTSTFRGIHLDDSGSVLNYFELTEEDIIGTTFVGPHPSSTKIIEIVPSPDNTFVVLGSNYHPFVLSDTESNFTWLTKIDIDGNIQWGSILNNVIDIPSLPDGSAEGILQMSDLDVSPSGEVFTVGVNYFPVIDGGGPPLGMQIQLLFKHDTNGNELWSKTRTVDSQNEFVSVLAHPSGDIYVKGHEVFWSTVLTRLTSTGDTVWADTSIVEYGIDYPTEYIPMDFCVLSDGNIGILEMQSASNNIVATEDQYLRFLTIDENNNALSIGTPFLTSLASHIGAQVGQAPYDVELIATSDNNMALVAQYSFKSPDAYWLDWTYELAYPYIAKPDTNGDIPTTLLSGQLFIDANNNCIYDIGEVGIAQEMISSEYFITITDQDGYYEANIAVPGNHTISTSFATAYPEELWTSNCEDSIEVFIAPDGPDITEIDFGFVAEYDCPRLEVDLSIPFLRPGFTDNFGSIGYENIGTLSEDSVSILITMDSIYSITPGSSSVPFTHDVVTNTYEFFIGTVELFESGYIFFEITCPVDVYLGATPCFEANILPFNECNMENPNWNGAELRLDATCEGDSVRFAMTNVGEEDMEISKDYAIYADDLLIQSGDIILESNSSMDISKYATGATYRIQADQVDEFPLPSFPEVSIELCNATSNTPTIGIINNSPSNDQAHHIDIECTLVSGSYDPNDKRTAPSGIFSQKYVNSDAELEYTIRFQNTGTDTAFNVFVLDTLSDFLDINTFDAGPASHDYELSMLPGRVIRWDFPNILLPDSTTNWAGSNGALKFTIQSVQGIPQPTEIHNTAAIFFDFNEPIITKDMFVTICDECLIQTLASDGVYFNGKVLLEGAYNSNGLMTNNLQNLIPMNQPFVNAPYFYNGSEQLSLVPTTMVDWVLVEAREGTPATSGQRATTTIETKAAILLTDGSIRGLDGISGVKFDNLTNDTPYHFCIRHRNHLDILTATALFPTKNIIYDFTTGVSQALGAAQLKWFGADAKAVMYAGDFNSDGVIQTTDYDVWSSQPAAIEVYDLPDANLDGVIQVSDYDKWFFNKAKVGNVEIGF